MTAYVAPSRSGRQPPSPPGRVSYAHRAGALARLIVAYPQAFMVVFVTAIMIGLKFVLAAVATHAGLTDVALIGVAIFVFGLWVDRRFPPDGFSLELQQEGGDDPGQNTSSDHRGNRAGRTLDRSK